MSTYIKGPALIEGCEVHPSSNGTTLLNKDSNTYHLITGTATHSIKLPDATTLVKNRSFTIINKSTDLLTVLDGNDGVLLVVKPGVSVKYILTTNASIEGSWVAVQSSVGGVETFNGREGDVVPLAGDYTAAKITFTPFDDIASTNVQSAIEEVWVKLLGLIDDLVMLVDTKADQTDLEDLDDKVDGLRVLPPGGTEGQVPVVQGDGSVAWEDQSGGGTGLIVPDIATRNAIPNEDREIGLTVTVLDDGNGRQKDYWLVGGITNSDWEEKKSGGGILTVPNETARNAIPMEERYEGLFAMQTDRKVLFYWTLANGGQWIPFKNEFYSSFEFDDNTPFQLPVFLGSFENREYIYELKKSLMFEGYELESADMMFNDLSDIKTPIKITLVNMMDGVSIRLKAPKPEVDYCLKGDDVYLGDAGQSATLLYLPESKRLVLTGRSN